MRKKLIIILSLLLCLVLGTAAFSVYGEAPPRNRIVMNSCDTQSSNTNSAIVVDESNFVDGSASIKVSSIIPNAYIDINTKPSGMNVNDAYLEFYFYADDASKYDFNSSYAFIKLTSQNAFSDSPVQRDSFVWTMGMLDKKVKTGWNYVALKFSIANFTGTNKQQVFENATNFFFIVWAKMKEDADTSNPNWWENYPAVNCNVDQLGVTDRPMEYGGADGELTFHYTQRMDEIQMRPGTVWVQSGVAAGLKLTAFILLGILGAGILTYESVVLIGKYKKAKGGKKE